MVRFSRVIGPAALQIAILDSLAPLEPVLGMPVPVRHPVRNTHRP